MVFEDNLCKVFHKKKGLILKSRMSSNRMFSVTATVIMLSCFEPSTEETGHLWHCRFGHLGYRSLQTLVQKNMVRGLPKLSHSSKVCDECQKGKQARDSFPKESSWRATQKLELIHADICGPIKPESHSKRRYFITFIDDFSRKTWVFLQVEKSAAFECFKQFKALVEKESSCHTNCLITNRGGEYTSNEFNEFCSSNGIKKPLTAAYTPQQNGEAERKNRTILNMVRCMLSGKHLPKEFWAYAVKWSVYVQNRSPTTALEDMTPEEAWSGLKPAVHYFRTFGCVAHVHVPEAQRKKLDDRSVKCILLGVSEESKAYQLYDPIAKRILISRDVKFVESESWKWREESSSSSTQEVELEE